MCASRQLVIGTGIATIWARDPMAMAAAQRTLAEAYPGRFVLGIGVRHAPIVDKAQATLRQALALPRRADPHSRAEIEAHLALALLIQGEVEPAEQVMEHGVPTEFGAEIELQFHFLGGALALARSDGKAVRDAAQAMAERVEATGYTVYAPVAAALAATADDPPPLTSLPQMLLLVR